eukprot:TRINITY_DN30857_c0_g1_i1.p1 TRINITY_DN30857_c0_g1~~TRINITY_DN30857_c0_g1_i1.p1  ORF type:complete len:419 (+),score=75.92 TRINITY_DN30857_c0_g1_i1:167-1423(+)
MTDSLGANPIDATAAYPSSRQTGSPIDDFVTELREEAHELWQKGGGNALYEEGLPSQEHDRHMEVFCTKLVAEALHEMLTYNAAGLQVGTQDNESQAVDQADPRNLEQESPEPRQCQGDMRAKLKEVRKKDAPSDDDSHGQACLARAQQIQERLILANQWLIGSKPQRALVLADEVLPAHEMRTWPVPELALLKEEMQDQGKLYGNLYSETPPLQLRCVRDSFVDDATCRDVCGYCIRGMHCMFRRGGQTSLAVSSHLARRITADGADLVLDLVERVRLQIIQDFGLGWHAQGQDEPILYHSGALLTRIQAEWSHDMWEITGEEEHVYWNAHVDKANVASYDYAALLYLNTQGQHFDGGDFAFIDNTEDCIVAPRRGRLLAFTAGPENLHQVRRVTSGVRFVLAMWFTLSGKHQRSDD